MVRASVLGVPVAALGRPAILARCGDFLAAPTLHHVVTANPEILLEAFRRASYRAILAHADLVVPDGRGVVWALRRKGFVAERYPGVELIVALGRVATREGKSLYLLGGRGGVAPAAAEALRRLVPPLRVEFFPADHEASTPPVSLWDHLRRVRPAVLAVAYGAPGQEEWIAAHRRVLEELGVRIAIGVGGALDILGGRIGRAPSVLRRAGLEWLWRLLREPRRLPRTFRATVVFPLRVMRSGRPAR